MTSLSWTSVRWIAAFGSIGLAGCVGADYGGVAGGTGPDAPAFQPTNPMGDDDDDVGQPVGLDFDTGLTGIVRDAWGAPIEGVAVSTSHGFSGTTDQDGRFAFEASADDHVVVSFQKAGYARSYVPFEVLPEVENAIFQRMAEVDFVKAFDSSVGLDFVVDEFGAEISLPPANFVDAEGTEYAGEVLVEATFYDLVSEPDDGLEIFAAPGDFSAIDAQGDAQQLESWGMVQVNLWGADGQELQLGSEAAPMRIPLQIQPNENASMPTGSTVPAWTFDTATGRWIEEGAGTIVQDADGTWYWEFAAPHFSSWNCDQPMPTHGCVTGIVTNSQGTPREGATVRAVGLTYTSTTTARTAADGSFCLEVKNGETVWIEVSYTISGQPATQRTDPVTTGTQATCTDGNNADCVDVGTLPIDIMTCVSGIVIDSQGNPVAWATVTSPQGGVAETDDSGAFCLAVPVFQTTEVYVVTSIDEPGYQPTRVFSQAGLPGCQNGCPNLAILRPYQQTACAQGEVWINNQAAQMVPVEAYDVNFLDTPVFTTTTNADGSYCIEVPVLGAGVLVRVGNATSPCGAETIDTTTLPGGVCDDSSWDQNAECVQVPTFECTM
jgi:hypothetical protein